MLRALESAGRAHLDGIVSLRPYGPWLVFNLVDYLQFLGLPLVLATLVTLAGSGGQPESSPPPAPHSLPQTAPGSLRRALHRAYRESGRLNWYGVLFWTLLLALDLSGATRGEVGRLWMPLTPLALLALFEAVRLGRVTTSHVHILLAAQFAVCVAIGGNWLTP